MNPEPNPFSPFEAKPATPDGHNPYAASSHTLTEADFQDETYEPRFFSWHGRLGRIRYLAFLVVGFWGGAFLLGLLVAALAPFLIGNDDPSIGVILTVWLPLLTLLLVQSKRRFNDLGLASGFSWLMLVPFLNALVFLYLLFAPGTSGPNRYGKPPVKNTVTLIVGALLLPTLFLLIVGFAAVNAYRDYQRKTQQHEQKLKQQQAEPAGEAAQASVQLPGVRDTAASAPEKDE